MQHWDENQQNDSAYKKKHLEDQNNQIKNLTQKNNALTEQLKIVESKNEKLANNGS